RRPYRLPPIPALPASAATATLVACARKSWDFRASPMELERALSNPRLQVELEEVSDLRTALGDRVRGRPALEVKPRCTAIIATVLQVLQLGDGQPMKLADIHSACTSLLGTDLSYRALKNGLSDHQRGRNPAVVRVRRGLYRLR